MKYELIYFDVSAQKYLPILTQIHANRCMIHSCIYRILTCKYHILTCKYHILKSSIAILTSIYACICMYLHVFWFPPPCLSIFSFLLLANQCTSSAYPRVNSFIPNNRPQAPQHAVIRHGPPRRRRPGLPPRPPGPPLRRARLPIRPPRPRRRCPRPGWS